MIIDGKVLAQKHQKVLEEKIKKLDKKPQVINIVVYSDDHQGEVYSEMKGKKALELGFKFETRVLNFDIEFDDLVKLIKHLNNQTMYQGIMVQLPIPFSREKTQQLLNLINPKKDIDGLNEESNFLPATIRGVISILRDLGFMNQDLRIKVVGGVRGLVGKRLVKALSDLREDVEGLSKDDPELDKKTLGADILVSSVGQKRIIKPNMVKKGAVLIDIGLGDFDEGCYQVASRYTPIRGGVGPMTIISLMENIVDFVQFHKRS